MDACLRVADVPDGDRSPEHEDDVLLDVVAGADSFEEYEWAGQRRIRATSLIAGGLRGAGFVTMRKGEEVDGDVDVVTDADNFGCAQYNDSDVILPSVDAEENTELRRAALAAYAGTSKPASNIDDDDEDDEAGKKEPTIGDLKRENEELRRSNMCKVCMDSYCKPLAAVTCWHVHCERCWLKSLGAKKLCPQCKVIVRPQDLRRIFL